MNIGIKQWDDADNWIDIFP